MPKLNTAIRSLVNAQLLTTDQATQVQEASQDKSPISYLVKANIISADKIADCLAQAFNLPLLDLDAFDPNLLNSEILNRNIIKEYEILPLLKVENKIFVALADPTKQDALNQIRFKTGGQLIPILVEEDKLSAYLKSLFHLNSENFSTTNSSTHNSLYAIDISTNGARFEDEIIGNSNGKDDTPIIRFVNKIITDAIHAEASDIHFEPYEIEYRIRYRHDGILREIAKPPVNLSHRLAARLKVMSNLDISEKRVPQDGRFKIQLTDKRSVGFRINTCPTLFGEKVVLRILDPSITEIGIEKLGFEPMQQKIFEETINKTQGMILVTGPTGSGKTVTLYSALNILNKSTTNISTVEDPVEIYLKGINQVNVNIKTGLDFSTALRAFLRQDPDIIMVGEIRDLETAEIAIKASQTGHLVLSTLHTNSAAESLTRLINMGIAMFNVATSITLVIAQRLVRQLCNKCKAPIKFSEQFLLEVGFERHELENLVLFKAMGCKYCIEGYKGRIGIYEMLPVTDSISRAIMAQTNSLDIAGLAKKEGMIDLRRAGLLKIKSGITTLEEIIHVTA